MSTTKQIITTNKLSTIINQKQIKARIFLFHFTALKYHVIRLQQITKLHDFFK